MSDPGVTSGTPAARARTVLIIWFGLVAATLVYVLLAYLLDQQQSMARSRILPPVVVGYSAPIALATGALFLMIVWAVGSAVGPSTMPVSPGAGGTERWGKIQVATVITGALAEAVAVIGLVLFFLGLPFSRFLLFAAVSLAVQVFNYFRIQAWIGTSMSG